jgi:hypothetical protein
VLWPDSAAHDILFAGENVCQYKTGNVGKSGVTSEFYKRGVQESLKRSGHYLFLIAKDCTPAKVRELQTCLAALCKKKRIPKGRCRILASEPDCDVDLSASRCRHMRELGKGLPGFSTVENWAALPALRNPWKPGAQRSEVQSRIKHLLDGPDPEDPLSALKDPLAWGKRASHWSA